jgi:hypothetical protein
MNTVAHTEASPHPFTATQWSLWQTSRSARLWMLASVIFAMSAVLWFAPPIALWPGYHEFTDRRTMLLIPNCLDVLSNLGFLLAGIYALLYLAQNGGFFHAEGERIPYLFFFTGVALTGFGSGYYHLAPSNFRLVWDLLPMTICFVSIVAATVIERISARLGLALLAPLIVFGMGSVLYWYLGEMKGHGDLRFYLFVQFAPVIAVGTMILLFPSRYSGTTDLFIVFFLFVVAKAAESLDQPIYSVHHIVSGHSLKHLIAGAGCYWMLRMLKRRTTADNPEGVRLYIVRPPQAHRVADSFFD